MVEAPLPLSLTTGLVNIDTLLSLSIQIRSATGDKLRETFTETRKLGRVLTDEQLLELLAKVIESNKRHTTKNTRVLKGYLFDRKVTIDNHSK